MKRDMDLVRELLLAIENDPKYDGTIKWMPDGPEDLGITGHSFEEFAYHLTMMIDAGLIEGKAGMQMPIFSKLTWDGHDFLDTIRDPVIWMQTKDGVKKAGGFSLDLLKALAKGFLTKKIEEHTGIQL